VVLILLILSLESVTGHDFGPLIPCLEVPIVPAVEVLPGAFIVVVTVGQIFGGSDTDKGFSVFLRISHIIRAVGIIIGASTLPSFVFVAMVFLVAPDISPLTVLPVNF